MRAELDKTYAELSVEKDEIMAKRVVSQASKIAAWLEQDDTFKKLHDSLETAWKEFPALYKIKDKIKKYFQAYEYFYRRHLTIHHALPDVKEGVLVPINEKEIETLKSEIKTAYYNKTGKGLDDYKKLFARSPTRDQRDLTLSQRLTPSPSMPSPSILKVLAFLEELLKIKKSEPELLLFERCLGRVDVTKIMLIKRIAEAEATLKFKEEQIQWLRPHQILHHPTLWPLYPYRKDSSPGSPGSDISPNSPAGGTKFMTPRRS